ncbi:MAG: aldose 1-epimerase [Acidimicrobiia bacterium]
MQTLRAGPATLRVDRGRGGRLASLLVHGHELLVGPPRGGAADPLLWGCYPMAPFAGRLRGGRFRWGGTAHQLEANHGGHAMHGTVFDRRWLIEQAEEDYLRLRAPLEPGWPLRGWGVQEMALRADGLELRLEVHAGDLPFPATAGWHPWFRRRLEVGGDVEVELRVGRWYPTGDDGLPTGHLAPVPPDRPWDDCFTAVTWPAVLTWPGALRVELHATCDHVVRYDRQPHAVCIEPQTGPPDAANLGLARIVRRHDPLVVEASLRWELL